MKKTKEPWIKKHDASRWLSLFKQTSHNLNQKSPTGQVGLRQENLYVDQEMKRACAQAWRPRPNFMIAV